MSCETEGGGGAVERGRGVNCWNTFVGLMQCRLSYGIAQRDVIRVRIGRSLGSEGLGGFLECDAIQDLIPLLI